MPREPFLGAGQKLTTTLQTRETHHRERASAVRSAYVRESQEVERLGSRAVFRRGHGGEASEEQQPRFLVGQYQVESRQSLPQVSVDALRVPPVLERRHKIIGKPNQVRLPSHRPPHSLLEPEVEHIVQIDVGEDGAERTALRRARLRTDDDPVLHDAGPEPFTNQAQNDAVRNAVRDHPPQPLMVDVVERTHDTLPIISTSPRRSSSSVLVIPSKANRSTCSGLCIGKVGSCSPDLTFDVPTRRERVASDLTGRRSPKEGSCRKSPRTASASTMRFR